jgi:hypothetical protein
MTRNHEIAPKQQAVMTDPVQLIKETRRKAGSPGNFACGGACNSRGEKLDLG